MTLAFGRVMVAVVRKRDAALGRDDAALGESCSRRPVFKLWNVTLPLAGASSTRLSVAGNVSDAETGTSRRWAGTRFSAAFGDGDVGIGPDDEGDRADPLRARRHDDLGRGQEEERADRRRRPGRARRRQRR